MSNNPTAGKGTPYWYEWSVGLLRVVDMLYPDSGISSVSFQESGIKGWDDVVVRFENNNIEFTQVKHTRERNNLTFGSFVTLDDQGDSLLKGLYGAWLDMGYTSATASCRVFTNREAGEKKYLDRPPLLTFFEWVKSEAIIRSSISEFQPPKELVEGWKEWCTQLNLGTDETRIDFLRALKIEASQPDLENLQNELCSRLATAHGVSFEKATPLLQALNSALYRWTDKHERVTREDVIQALILPDEIDVHKLAPAPPFPFFPSREQNAQELEVLLAEKEGTPIIFLSAAPGAGKTSLMSRLEMRRSEDVFGGIIDLRYFAFRPITPEQHGAPSESDFYVDPKGLWFSLLSQLRRKLKGKLAAYEVPVRNELLSWSEARSHVMRLGDHLGRELGRKFIIAIDGIDHAARAGRLRYEYGKAEDFFRSLPGPDELSNMEIRLLIAGQPAANYQEYPIWLKQPDPKVRMVPLNSLTRDDIAALLREKGMGLPKGEWDDCVTVIAEQTQGNTLAVVFAVAEASTCSSLDELHQHLADRKLQDGLEAYYSYIWSYALKTVAGSGEPGIGVGEALAGTLCLLREPVNGDLLESAFPTLMLSSDQWNLVLRKTGPLVLPEGSGFQVIHNDIRVFLTRELGARSPDDLAWVASCLVDYYCTVSSDRETAHASLPRLLDIAGRSSDWAKLFDVRWVFEAAALGQPFADAVEQSKAALRAAIELQNWELLHEVTCAIESLERWENNRHAIPQEEREAPSPTSLFFPLSEILVTPWADWTLANLQQVASDVQRILSNGENGRANSLLDRWFGGIKVNQLADQFYQSGGDVNRNEIHNRSVNSLFESLGEACRGSGYFLGYDAPSNEFQNLGIFYFERGWVERSCVSGSFESIARCFDGSAPRYFHNGELAIEILARRAQWRLVGRLLRCFHKSRDKFTEGFRRFATWWCVRSGVEGRSPGWLEVLEEKWHGPRDASTGTIDELLAIAKARGWLAPAKDLSALTDLVFSRSSYSKGTDVGIKVPLRAAAMLGQAGKWLAGGNTESLCVLIPPSHVKQVINALWSGSWRGPHLPTEISFAAGDLAVEIVETFFELGEKYKTVLVEAALPIAVDARGDFRVKGAWLALKKAGELAALRQWGERVLGENGWLWEEEYSSRASLGQEFLARMGDIGEPGLIDVARRKLKWQRIGYRGHKDYSFQWPCRWFSELARKAALSVMDEGYRLLGLSEFCEAQGGENSCSSEINEALGMAAILDGPDAIWRLIFSTRQSRGHGRWLYETKQMILGGFEEHLTDSSCLDEEAKIALWCLSIGVVRWFDSHDVASIASIRKRLLKSTGGNDGVQDLGKLLLRISPGEAIREPWITSDSEEESEHEEPFVEDYDWETTFEAGQRLSPIKVVAAVKDLNARGESDRAQKLPHVLERFGINNSFAGGWSNSDELKGTLDAIVKAVPDSQLWSLAKAAILKIEEGGYWYPSVCENLNMLLLSRASVRGEQELRLGLDHLLRMHERWARGGDMSLSVQAVQPADGPHVEDWKELAARTLTELLSSRYGVVLESTIVGINALVVWRPNVLSSILAGCTGNKWRTKWICSLLEVWATERPEALRPIESHLQRLGQNEVLSIRLQVWIVRQLLAASGGDEGPFFAFADHSPEESEVPKVGGIFETTTDIRGSFQFTDAYKAAQSRLRRIEFATGLDLSDIAPKIGSGLLARNDESESTRSWQESIRNDPDFFCTGESAQYVFDRVLDSNLTAGIDDREELLQFAQGALSSDEGWILRNSPIPFQNMERWPRESLLEGGYSEPPTDDEVWKTLAETAHQTEVRDDEIVIAACFKAYSWREDFLYCSWFAESDEPPDVFKEVPSTLSGRTFPWMLGSEWSEPELPKDLRSIAFKAGGLQQLLMSSPEIIPSHLWCDSFGWRASPTNPFEWMCGGVLVARFEVRHGPPLNHSRNAGRQALLHRWIAKKEAFFAATASMPLLKPCQHFSRIRFYER